MGAVHVVQRCIRSGHDIPSGFWADSSDFWSERISMSAVKNDSVDSDPWFWLGRSGCKPSLQPPVTQSYREICRSLSPRNQLKADQASFRQRLSPVIRYASRHADTAPAASIGC